MDGRTSKAPLTIRSAIRTIPILVLGPDSEEDAPAGATRKSTNEFMKKQDEEGME